MTWITERLRNSRLSAAVAQMEKGEVVDWKRFAELQAMDFVTGGQLALADAIDREREFDDRLEQLLNG